MEYPITKERLQNFKENELPEISKKKFVNASVEYVCDQISTILVNTDETKCVVQIQVMYKNAMRSITNYRIHVGLNEFIPDIVAKLQERFIDSVITVDPENTNMYIDWS